MENNIVGFRPGQVIFPKIAPVSFLKKDIPKRLCMQTATQKGAWYNNKNQQTHLE